MPLFEELKRRNVFRVAAAYLVGAWLLIEVSATLEETLRLPEWADSLLAMFLILGFPVALFFSWAYEITPDGIKRETDLDEGESSRAVTSRRLDWAVIFMVALAITFFVVDRFVLKGSEPLSADKGSDPIAEIATEEAPDEILEPAPSESVAIPNLSIAVLPFVNMSSDPEQEYFSDGLTEELLNLLAGIEELKVAARTSSFYYKDKLDDIKFDEVAAELGVAHILEGSVRKGGDRIRITAQLIKAGDGFHLWSETYDRTLDDVFAIQDEIAAAVVDELKITLLGDEPHATVIDTESWELTLQGRFLFNRRAPGDLDQAFELFERATQIDPENSAAWVGVSPLYNWLFDPPRREEAIAAARKATELEPDMPEAWARLARALGRAGDEEGYDTAWAKAVELGQESPLILGMLAGQQSYRGEFHQAIETLQKALSLDPLHLVNMQMLANCYLYAGQLDQAEPIAHKAMDLAPSSTIGYNLMAKVRLLQGRPEAAREIISRGPVEEDIVFLQAYRKQLDLLIADALGENKAADSKLEQYITVYGQEFPNHVAMLYAWRGDKDQAFAWLDNQLENGMLQSPQELANPFFNSLHDDPRWNELYSRAKKTWDFND